MDYGDLARRLVMDAITKKVKGLNKKVTFHLYVSEGVYDANADATVPVYNNVEDVVVVAAKPGFEDVKGTVVLHSDVKLLVPGLAIPQEPKVDVDKVTLNGALWDIKKVIGVPGEALWLVYCREV
jgi:hypothetical protein